MRIVLEEMDRGGERRVDWSWGRVGREGGERERGVTPEYLIDKNEYSFSLSLSHKAKGRNLVKNVLS